MANNSYQFEQVDLASLPEKIDEKGFVSLCEKVLGIKWDLFYYIFFYKFFISSNNLYFDWINEKNIKIKRSKSRGVDSTHLLGLKLELVDLSNLVLTNLVLVRFFDDFILLS